MHNYKELDVWKRSIDMVSSVYGYTKQFPDSERFSLTNQIQRSAVSVPSNIAEGSGRTSNKEFAHYLSIAIGSCFELETQLIIAKNVGYFTSDDLFVELNEIQKMLRGLIKKLAAQ